MKKRSCLITGLLCICIPLAALELLPVTIENAMLDLERIASYFPRAEGSQNEERLFAYLEERLTALQVPFTRLDYTNSINYHSFSSGLSVKLEGKRPDTLLVTIPVDHPADSELSSSGSINLALGLALLEHFKGRELPLSLQLNFIGAEFGNTDNYPLGSRLFLERFFPESPVMQIYLNLRNIPARVSIRCGGEDLVSPYWMITRCTEALQAAAVPFLIRGNENQLFRFGLDTSTKNHLEPYLAREIPSLSFTGEYTPLKAAAQKDWLFGALQFFEEFLQQFPEGIPQEWDRHYLLFQAQSFFLIIDEQLYLVLLIIILSLSVIYILIFTRLTKKIFRLFFRHIWQLFLILGITFAFLMLSSLVLKALAWYRNTPDLWRSAPLLFFTLKISLGACFFLLFRKAINGIPFTNSHTFYLTAGIITLLLNLLAIAVINLSFTYYFLWAFLFFLLSNIARKTVLRILFFLPSSYWMLKTTFEFLLMGQPTFSRFLLHSSPLESLIIAVIILPFVLYPIAILKKLSVKVHEKAPPIIFALFLTLAAALVVHFMTFDPYSADNPQQITVENIIDLNTRENNIEISSAGPLGHINLWVGDQPYFIESETKKYIIPLDNLPELVKISHTQTSFLDRKNISLAVLTSKPCLRVSLSLTSQEEFTLFDSSFPFKRKQKGTEYEILIGAHPPNPLPIQLTLPAGHSFTLHFTVEYQEMPFRFELSGRHKQFSSRLSVRQDIQLDT